MINLPQFHLKLLVAQRGFHLLLSWKWLPFSKGYDFPLLKSHIVQGRVHENIEGCVTVDLVLQQHPPWASCVVKVAQLFAPENLMIPKNCNLIHLTPHRAEQYWRQLGLYISLCMWSNLTFGHTNIFTALVTELGKDATFSVKMRNCAKMFLAEHVLFAPDKPDKHHTSTYTGIPVGLPRPHQQCRSRSN